MTKRALIAMMLATTLTACRTSPPPLTIARNDNQRGALGTVYMNNGTQHDGELLALDDSSVVLLTHKRVAMGALSHIERLEFDEFDIRDVASTPGLSASMLKEGREVSRFPYGITRAAMATLLANAKQKTPDRLEAMAP